MIILQCTHFSKDKESHITVTQFKILSVYGHNGSFIFVIKSQDIAEKDCAKQNYTGHNNQ